MEEGNEEQEKKIDVEKSHERLETFLKTWESTIVKDERSTRVLVSNVGDDNNDHGVDKWLFKSVAEVNGVKELRTRLDDLKNEPYCNKSGLNLSDSMLLCYYRARKGDLNKAEKMFRDSFAWHNTIKPDVHASTFKPNSVLIDYGTGGLFGVDKDGTPVFYDRLGMSDSKGLLSVCTEKDFVDYEIIRKELMLAVLERASTKDAPQYQLMVVQDLKGLGLRHWYTPGLNVLKACTQIGDLYYPERAKRVILINCPTIFTAIWKIVSFFFDEVTRDKIQIYRHDGKEELLKYIDEDQLPKFLGGKATYNNDPECLPIIKPGGYVPKDYKVHDPW